MTFARGLSFGKCLQSKFRNFLPMSEERFAAKGGLNQVTFLFLCFFFRLFVASLSLALYSSFELSLYPLSRSAFSYGGLALSKSSLQQDKLLSRLLIISGICLMMVGG